MLAKLKTRLRKRLKAKPSGPFRTNQGVLRRPLFVCIAVRWWHYRRMEEQKKSQSRATRGGVYILAFTATMIALKFGAAASSTADRVLIAVVVAVLIFAIFRLNRFIREHGDEIGEARFDTRNREP